MIPIERLLYKIDFKLNKISSGQFQNISTPDKILALNEAQVRLLKKKVNINNLYQSGFDSFKSRYEDLQNLVVPYESLVPVKTSENYTSYKVSISDLKFKYFLPVDLICFADRGSCKNRLLTIPRITRHGSLSSLIQNPHFCPSFRYQETLSVISSNDIMVYANDPEGDFKVNEVQISYLRYPKEVDYEGYTHFDGTPSQIANCELPDHLEDELVELAVNELALNTGNINAAEAATLKSRNSE